MGLRNVPVRTVSRGAAERAESEHGRGVQAGRAGGQGGGEGGKWSESGKIISFISFNMIFYDDLKRSRLELNFKIFVCLRAYGPYLNVCVGRRALSVKQQRTQENRYKIVMLMVRAAFAFALVRTALSFTFRPLEVPTARVPVRATIVRLFSSAAAHRPTEPPTDAQLSLGSATPIRTVVPKKFVSFPFMYHEELDVTVDSLTNLGVGVCRVNIGDKVEGDDSKDKNSKGWVVFVPSVLPGERVRVKIFRNHATYSSADLLEVLEPSEHRVEPRCELFEKCGGCQVSLKQRPVIPSIF